MPTQKDPNSPKRLSGFQPGHPKYPTAGRKKRTAQMARDLATKLGCDPLDFMMKIINCDTFTQTAVGEDGQKRKVEVTVDLATRLDAAKAVTPFLYPRLNAQQVTGTDGAPIAVAALDVNKLLADPAALELAQTLALRMTTQGAPQQLPAPAAVEPEPESGNRAPDPVADAERDSRGHWKPK